MNHTENNG
jgi:hypothetical protein